MSHGASTARARRVMRSSRGLPGNRTAGTGYRSEAMASATQFASGAARRPGSEGVRALALELLHADRELLGADGQLVDAHGELRALLSETHELLRKEQAAVLRQVGQQQLRGRARYRVVRVHE